MRRSGKVDTDDKILNNPLFPRMHVSDRAKGGGPKPPPRNKMSLYEQPAAAAAASHRIICSGSAPPAMPLPPPNYTKYSAIGASAPSNYHNGGLERSGLAMQINSPAAAPERIPFYAHNNGAAMMNNASMPPLLPFPMFDGQVTSSPNSGCEISQLLGVSSSHYVKDNGRHNEKPLPVELKMFQQIHFRNETNGNKGRVVELIEAHEQSYAAANVLPPAIKTISSIEWQPKRQSNQHCSRKRQCVKSQTSDQVLDSGSRSAKPANDNVGKVGASELLRSEICTKVPPTDDITSSPDGLAIVPKPHKDMLPELHIVGKKKDDCRWEISATESTSNLHTRPEDVIAIIDFEIPIPTPRFPLPDSWHVHLTRTRLLLFRHQKLFADQVFELHKLIAVQKLMAQTRRTSHEEADRHKKLEKPSSSRTSYSKEPQKGHNNNTVERQNDSTMPKSLSECPKEMFYHPPQSKDPFKVPSIIPRANQAASARNPKPTNVAGISTPWIYSHPGTANHWLVPVLSPSEGLIYKPYPIPSAPSPAGFMPPPTYGSWETIHINPLKRPAQTHPSSQHSGIRPFADIPPYSPPVATPSSSNTATTSTSPFDQAVKDGRYHHPNIALADGSFRSSRNFSSLGSATVSCDIDVIQQPKDGGAHQDSTASSSPPDRAQGKILPLFPVDPTAIAMQNKLQHPKQAQCQSSEQQSKVIKSVPHHPKSAPESAARIFKSIHE